VNIRNLKLKIKNLKFRYRYAMTIFYIFLVVISWNYIKYSTFAQSINAPSTNSASTTDSQQTIQEKQQQIDDLKKKEETYRQMIELKQNKAQTLENQISLMENQISTLESDITVLQDTIDKTTLSIDELEVKVKEKEDDIGQRKEILSRLIQTYYESNQDSAMEIVLRNASFSEFLSQSDYVSQTGVKMDNVLAGVVEIKTQLESEKKELEIKNAEQKEQQGKVLEKQRYLGNEQDSKQQLLDQTHGEEQQYQDLLVRVEQQKQELLGDIDQLSQEKSSDLAAVEATLEKPKLGLASTKWYFNQRDPSWGDQHIGFSNTLMKSYGCAVTAISMILKYHNVDIDPGTMAQQPIFYHDLIVWPKQWKGVELVSSTGHGNIDWDVVDQELKNKNPIIVFVKATKRGAGHYVVIHSKDKSGDYVVHDPYWGSNIFLSSTRAYVGALYNSPTAIDQMIIYH
jgi:peptidoglycan hydrolase CwlO-like protein